MKRKSTISKEDAVHFIHQAYESGYMVQQWSESIVNRIASGLVRSLADFNLADKGRKSERTIQQFRLAKPILHYLVFDLHFADLNDTAIIQHPDWKLFGFDVMDVVRAYQCDSGDYFIVQYTEEFTRISWNYASREDSFRAIAEKEF